MSTEIVLSKSAAVLLAERDGIEMGVFSDGTPFLTSRGLARLAGVAASAILGWLPTLDQSKPTPRDTKLLGLLAEQGYPANAPLLVKLPHEGANVNAHPDAVCMAVLEYYAFEAGRNCNEQALRAFRILARHSLRQYVYVSLGYDPTNAIPENWRHFHDRVSLNRLPAGYFSVFSEMSSLIVSAIQHGLTVDNHTVPDISVGQIWSAHWKEIGGDQLFGPRVKYPHVYPDHFPQAQVTPEAWIYPHAALGEFRTWMQEIYLPEKYPNYIGKKVKAGVLPPSRAELLLEAVMPKQLEA